MNVSGQICRNCKSYERCGVLRGQGVCHHPDRKEEDRPVFGRWGKELSGCENFAQGRYREPKIAIAFGWGRESAIMLENLLDKKPILIYCLGNETDVDEKVFRMFGKALGLKTIIIPSGDENFKDKFDFNEVWASKPYVLTNYTNTILRYYQNKKKPFDVLYVGRKRKDISERCKIPLKCIPEEEPQEPGVRFPLWNL